MGNRNNQMIGVGANPRLDAAYGADKVDNRAPEQASQGKPDRRKELTIELRKEEEHAQLQREGEQLLRAVGPARSQIEEQLSLELYRWFKHQGFWPEWWDPQAMHFAAYGASDKEERTITIPFSEYVRLKKMEKLGLIVTEVAETMEAVRNDDEGNEREELADIDVRLHDYKGGFGLTNDAAPFKQSAAEGFLAKMLKNFQRPFRHGKKF